MPWISLVPSLSSDGIVFSSGVGCSLDPYVTSRCLFGKSCGLRGWGCPYLTRNLSIGYAAGSLGVLFSIIPFKVNPSEFLPLPVGCYLVVLLKDFEEMYCVLLPEIFDAEIIHYQDELDKAPFMAPEPRCCGCLVVACFIKLCTQQVIRKSSVLR